MPPRFVYWTILVDNQPTAFRAATIDDIMPTFNRLKDKQPTAVLRWFQQGQLWNSPLDARAALQKRREQGRKPARPRTPPRGPSEKLSWTPKGSGAKPAPDAGRVEWQPRRPGATPRVERGRAGGGRPEWKPAAKTAKPTGDRPVWRPKSKGPPRPPQGTRGVSATDRNRRTERPEWKPKAATGGTGDQQKAPSTEPRRDRTWRPGGDHKDPRQKYKDAKKAKWTRFKQAIRARSGKRKP